MPPYRPRTLRRYLDENPSALVRFAEAVCKACCALLILSGLALIGAAVYMLVAAQPGGAESEQAWKAAEKGLLAGAAPLPVVAFGLTGLATVFAGFVGMAGASLRRLSLLNFSVVLLPLLCWRQSCAARCGASSAARARETTTGSERHDLGRAPSPQACEQRPSGRTEKGS